MSGGAAKTRRVKRDIDFAAPPVLVYCPKGLAGEGCVSFAEVATRLFNTLAVRSGLILSGWFDAVSDEKIIFFRFITK